MSSPTTSRPEAAVDERSTAEPPSEPPTDPAAIRDELPFESPEFGIGGFFPHLEGPTDG